MAGDGRCRLRFVVTCDVCGDVAEVGTMAEGSAVADAHETAVHGTNGPDFAIGGER